MSSDAEVHDAFNISNSSSQDVQYTDSFSLDKYYIITVVLDFSFAIFGSLLNLWFLVAILRSADARASMRNKLISNILIAHLTETTLECPIAASMTISTMRNSSFYHFCNLLTVFSVIYHINDFVANFTLVILLGSFLCQVLNFDLTSRLLPRWVKILTFVLLLFPWIFSVIYVPINMYAHFPKTWGIYCLHSTEEALRVFKILDTIVPQILGCIILVVAGVCSHDRCSCAKFSDTRQLITEGGQQRDSMVAYVLLFAAALLCDLPLMIVNLNPSLVNTVGFVKWIYLFTGFTILALSRVFVMTLLFLLFPDIRQQIKTWRPWNRTSASNVLTVTYERNAS